MNIFERIDLLIKYTDPDKVDCGPGYHRHEGENYCHEISRKHGEPGRPSGSHSDNDGGSGGKKDKKPEEKKGGVAVAEQAPPKAPNKRLGAALGGWKPPVNGKVAQAHAIDALGAPLHPKQKANIGKIDLSQIPKEHKASIVEALEELPQHIVDTVNKIAVQPTQDDKIVTIDPEKGIIILHKTSDGKTPINEEYVKESLYHNVGHNIWGKLTDVMRQTDIKLYTSAKSHPRAFFTNLSRLNEINDIYHQTKYQPHQSHT